MADRDPPADDQALVDNLIADIARWFADGHPSFQLHMGRHGISSAAMWREVIRRCEAQGWKVTARSSVVLVEKRPP